MPDASHPSSRDCKGQALAQYEACFARGSSLEESPVTLGQAGAGSQQAKLQQEATATGKVWLQVVFELLGRLRAVLHHATTPLSRKVASVQVGLPRASWRWSHL